jgi:hypothetical protein
MDFAHTDCFGGGPLFDQAAVLAILDLLFLLFVWRALRPPAAARGSPRQRR